VKVPAAALAAERIPAHLMDARRGWMPVVVVVCMRGGCGNDHDGPEIPAFRGFMPLGGPFRIGLRTRNPR
jgi:hypothetical protein